MSRYWHHMMVAAAIIEGPSGILLVENRRSWQDATEWSLPAGILDPGETLIETAAREVSEETGLTVESWGGLAYVVHRIFADRKIQLGVHVFSAKSYSGEIELSDPDGIVVDACWADAERVRELMPSAAFHQPIGDWLTGPRSTRIYEYREIAGEPDELLSRSELGAKAEDD